MDLSAEGEHVHIEEESGEMATMVSLPVPGDADWSGAIETPTGRLADLSLGESADVDSSAAAARDLGGAVSTGAAALEGGGTASDAGGKASDSMPGHAGLERTQGHDTAHAEGPGAKEAVREAGSDNLQDPATECGVKEGGTGADAD
jgi:hypothetical protein